MKLKASFKCFQIVTTSVLLMSSQNTKSPDHVLSLQHLVCPCPVRIPLPTYDHYSQHPISSAHVQSVPHFHSPYLASTQYLKPMSSQYQISTANVQSEYHLYCPRSITIPPLLPMASLYHIVSVHVQTVSHLHNPYPDST